MNDIEWQALPLVAEWQASAEGFLSLNAIKDKVRLAQTTMAMNDIEWQALPLVAEWQASAEGFLSLNAIKDKVRLPLRA